ncbi:cytochrome P450 [Streptomyces sp. NPDC055078]
MTDEASPGPQPGVNDPAVYEWWRRMRESHPVRFDPSAGMWQVFRYDDVARVLADPATFSSEWPRMAGCETGLESLPNTDPPRHHQMRALIGKAFSGRVVAELEPRITRIAHDLIASVPETGRADLVNDIAYPFPVMVILDLLDLPAQDLDLFLRWTRRMMSFGRSDFEDESFGTDMSSLFTEVLDYLRAQLRARRRHPGDDMLSMLATAEIDGERLTEDDIVKFANAMFNAGHVTTTMAIAHSVQLLDAHPETMARVRKDRGLLPAVVEESLRCRTILSIGLRMTTAEVSLGGQTIPEKQMVQVSFASANRDERQFGHPEVFDIDRSPNRHLGFGHGIHHCIGASLGRLQTRILLDTLFRRYPDVRLDPDGEVTHAVPPFVVGLASLPVLLPTPTGR